MRAHEPTIYPIFVVIPIRSLIVDCLDVSYPDAWFLRLLMCEFYVPYMRNMRSMKLFVEWCRVLCMSLSLSLSLFVNHPNTRNLPGTLRILYADSFWNYAASVIVPRSSFVCSRWIQIRNYDVPLGSKFIIYQLQLAFNSFCLPDKLMNRRTYSLWLLVYDMRL